jgi:hypothetical protein
VAPPLWVAVLPDRPLEASRAKQPRMVSPPVGWELLERPLVQLTVRSSDRLKPGLRERALVQPTALSSELVVWELPDPLPVQLTAPFSDLVESGPEALAWVQPTLMWARFLEPDVRLPELVQSPVQSTRNRTQYFRRRSVPAVMLETACRW